MGWALGGFGIFLVLLLAAGATVVICKRYSVTWQCGPRDVWIICEEWRRKLSWLWAPREEKVGLVKAQHPTAQAVPGLYRQSSTNSSQYILHSDSDLRLDAQGAFTRFEAVDRDLHPPGQLAQQQQQQQLQQQSPNQHNNNIPPQPLRPAPQPRATARPRPSPLSTVDYLRLQECEPCPLTPPPPPPPAPGKFPRSSMFLFQAADSPSPPPLPPPPSSLNHTDFAALHRGINIFSQHRILGQEPMEEQRKIRYTVQGTALSDQLFGLKDPDSENDSSPPYGSYDIVHDTRANFDSIYSPQETFSMHRVPSTRNLQDLERITRYIQSLPDTPQPPSPTGGFYDATDEEAASPAAPPPPAPPDPGSDTNNVEHEPTIGEKIFKTAGTVRSQSYIDASEFYNSIVSSAQYIQNLFSTSASIDDERLNNSQQASPTLSRYNQNELPRRACDLYNPELNQEAHRTAQQVYNSLQDPPASPLLLKDVDQDAYSYLSDPSFTRTSEDIFNSLEHRRKSVQDRLNGFHELLEMEAEDAKLRRNSQELLNALEEVQMKRRLSQIFDECPQQDDQQQILEELERANSCPVSRRGSLGPEPEPPPSPLLYANLDDLSCLQHAVSCESVCSDTSVVLNDLETGTEESPVVGLICIGLEHDRNIRSSLFKQNNMESQSYLIDAMCRWPSHIGETDLIVSVLEARDLVAPDGRPAQNTYARVCLLPDRQTHVQTRLYKETNSPSYQEKFYFPLEGGPVGRTLLVEVFSYDLPNGESTLLGEATLRLGPAPRPPATTWLPVISPALPAPQLGELMFSLSYLPTAERLTLVVVKARNLRAANEETSGDFFVKVYLLQQGKKLHKKRTSIKRGEKSPIFNEAIIFNVPAHALQNVQLRLTVAEVPSDVSAGTKPNSVGHVIVGASTSGRALTHWRQMLAALRRPVAMWHPLRK